MALELRRSFVPKIAVENTIRRGIEMYQKFHGPVTQEIADKIRAEVIRQANIMNASGGIKEDEAGDSPIFYRKS